MCSGGNAQAIIKLRNEFKVNIRDTPKDFFPEFVRATNVVMDRYAAKDAFFKEVLDSQRKFGQVVVRSNPLPRQLSGPPFDRILVNADTQTRASARYAGHQPGSEDEER